MKGARLRTESMVQKLSKQPMSEGFALMDKKYLLGALRLFTVKAETAPPFQLGPCLDGVAGILALLGESEDAAENFGYAAEKFDLIMQPVVAKLMRAKAAEQKDGPEAALTLMDEALTEADPATQILSMAAGKPKESLARAYHYRAELKYAIDQPPESGMKDATLAAAAQWDRGFMAHYTLGLYHCKIGDEAAALVCFRQSIALNSNFLGAIDAALDMLGNDTEQWLTMINKAIEIHPRLSDFTAKAMKLCDLGRDAEAIALLDAGIVNPPQDEALGAGSYTSPGETKAALHKAKGAIYADQDKFEDAKTACQHALALLPEDGEAAEMLKRIEEMMATAAASPTTD